MLKIIQIANHRDYVIMSSSIHSLDDLVVARLLPEITIELRMVAEQYPLAITPSMLALINPDDPDDPIAAQFIPSLSELKTLSEEMNDPIGDEVHSPIKGIVHRYPDRVLLITHHTCPVHCRFCFRRKRVGCDNEDLSIDEIKNALTYIRENSDIWEVIFSGGEPLMLEDNRLFELITVLNEIEHVKIIRIHTRMPVVNPARITSRLVDFLRGGKPVYIFLHCNHARELTTEARAACARLVEAGIPLLSQSVLLHGVNDKPEILNDLMRTFVETRVKPHYLHHMDLAYGTNHFRVSIDQGTALLRSMRGNMSGLCQPQYILDLPGGFGKVPIGPAFVVKKNRGWLTEDFRGCIHFYQEPKSNL